MDIDVEAAMTVTRTVELPVSEEAARILADDPGRARQLGLLVEQVLVHSRSDGAERLSELLEHTSAAARKAGLIDPDIDAELRRYKAGRRHPRSFSMPRR